MRQRRDALPPPQIVTAEPSCMAVPRRGHVLSTVVEKRGDPIRDAVTVLAESLAQTHQCSAIYGSLFKARSKHLSPIIRPDSELAAWALVSMWVVGVSLKVLPTTATIVESEEWFFASNSEERLSRLLSSEAIKNAEAALHEQADAFAYSSLLPYLLDPHGPGSRLSVRRDPTTREAQVRKRAEGVFYTPADVAEYMASSCFDGLSFKALPSVFDPACGTGVFLRAALKKLRSRYPELDSFSLATECLFGVDIDPWAIDAAAFVLLADSWAGHKSATSPASAWQQLRLNLVCVDTLRIDPAGGRKQAVPRRALSLFDTEQDNIERIPISQLFAAHKLSPTVILGNPPYADLGMRQDLDVLSEVYETIAVKPGPTAELYLTFIEQMVRLADEETCSGALVLPLSVACNVGRQFSALRKIISKTRGRWRFSFFDREPHALFGEDVKTRNAIMLWTKGPADKTSSIATGPLCKWRGDSRAEMFRSIRFTPLSSNIEKGIPKVDGECQARALLTLEGQSALLGHSVQGIERIDLARTPREDDKTVFVGPTAYNFINVFMASERSLAHGQQLSEHPLHAVRCSSEEDAFAVFAILSSHLAYWWWHTHGDGFHVSRSFLAEMPVGPGAFSSKATKAALAEYGAELWALIKTKPIISVNRGRTSFAYTPNGHDEIRRKIDQALADLLGVEEDFVAELQQFTARTVAAALRQNVITQTEEERA